MRTHVLLGLLAIALATATSCRERAAPVVEGDTLTDVATSKQDTVASDLAAPSDVIVATFDPRDLPNAIRVDRGMIRDGARWRDRNGDNIIVVTERVEPVNDTQVQTLDASHFVSTDSVKWKRLWLVHDNATNVCDLGRGLTSSVVVRDLDGDGVAESAFVYNLEGACDVSPIGYKLILHSGAAKYAIRGTNRIFDGSDSVGGKRTYDRGFPDAYRQFADSLWSTSVKGLVDE